MAEIHVQRKRPSLWPGIVAALAIVLLTWVLAETWGNDDEQRVDEAVVSVPSAPDDIAPTSGASPSPPAEVAAFLTFTAMADGPETGPAHDYTAAGIHRLSSALDAIARDKKVGGQNVRDRLQAFRRTAQRIQSNPEATAHSNQVRDVFMSAANLMTAMQQDRWPDDADMRSALEEARTAAGALNRDRPLLEQLSAVRQFFDRAAIVLREMVEET